MPALVAGIHVLLAKKNKDVDGRNKSGHDGLLVPLGSISTLPAQRRSRPTRFETRRARVSLPGRTALDLRQVGAGVLRRSFRAIGELDGELLGPIRRHER